MFIIPIIYTYLLLLFRLPFAWHASDFAMLVLEKANVATVTGDAFGAPNCIRISYAASQKDLKEAVKRIADLLS